MIRIDGVEKVEKVATECEEGLRKIGGQSGSGEDVGKGERGDEGIKGLVEFLKGCERARRDFRGEVCEKGVEIGAEG